MKTTATLSSRQSAGKSEILVRISVSHQGQFRIKTHLYIRPDRFKDGKIVIPRYLTEEQTELTALQGRLNELLSMLTDYCLTHAVKTSAELQNVVEAYHNPAKVDTCPFWSAWSQWEAQTKVSELRHRRYKVMRGMLERMERYTGKRMTLDITADTLLAIEHYIRDEHMHSDAPLRGDNVIHSLMSVFRTFVNWCVKVGKVQRNPFSDYTMPTTIYGTPYYLTIEERDTIADHDYCDALNKQRDVFVFQCLTGCRVGDLLRLTADNIVDGCLEYTPAKTINKSGNVVRVPLCERAQNIVDRWTGNAKLLPFISEQKYNDAIKALMVFAKIDRRVTVLNPITHKEERKPICEVASSHLARRTFIGNLYKQVQDPNLIGSMSGHAEGSRAFSRYRTIDEDIKRRAIDLIR